MRWDVFCRVVDNLGDVGVCWRLAADLAARGHQVRLVIDDTSPLQRIAPDGAAGVEVMPWPAVWPAGVVPGDVVIEAFGCDPPPEHVAAMLALAASRPPLWINLEYLSAEPYVERSHGLPSPQRNGLTKWFYYPGFTARTGGLLREPGLLAERAAFDGPAWLQAHGVQRQPGERLVSLFCYPNAAIPALLQSLAQVPTLLLLTPGFASEQVASTPSNVRLQNLPWLLQHDFDRLLWCCAVNFVRGEDSLVRALWAGAPFVWQIYPQHDGAHVPKLDAMLARLQLPADLAELWRAWNGLVPWPSLPALGGWSTDATAAARADLLAQPDLVTQLLRFVDMHRAGEGAQNGPGC